jgi:transcriptional regulator with XRE-family HTH domain
MALDEKGFQRLFNTDLATLGGAELARRIGVGPQHISDVKHGHRMPGPKVLAYYGLEKVVETVRTVTYVPAKKGK